MIDKLFNLFDTHPALSVLLILLVATFFIAIIIIICKGGELSFATKDGKKIGLRGGKGKDKGYRLKDNKNDVELIKNIIFTAFDTYAIREQEISKKVKSSIKNSDKDVVDSLIRKVMMDYAKLIDDTVDDNDVIREQDIFELYITRDLNKIILEKLENLYNSPTFSDLENADLSRLVESTTSDVIDILKLSVRKYTLLSSSPEDLERVFENASRYLLDELRRAIKNYTEYTNKEKEEKLKLIKARSENIDKQIIKVLGGNEDGNNSIST